MWACVYLLPSPILLPPLEAKAAEAEFVADAKEVIGLQENDDITTQAPLSTVLPVGERVSSHTDEVWRKLSQF